jgi:hypothetical protein
MTPAEMTDNTMQAARQDESAVAAVRSGDAERYRELVERHERRVFAVAWSRLGDAALAEEAAQEAFIRAYRRLWLLIRRFRPCGASPAADNFVIFGVPRA